MRITQVHIDGFGKWQNVDFTFDDHFQMIYGANEAGKTTLQRFIHGVLFGFATGKHPAEQYIPKSGAGYGGAVTFVANDKNQTVYRVQRTAGKSGGDVTLLNVTTNTTVDILLPELLGGVDQQFAESTFSFDLAGLQALTATSQEALIANVQRVGAVGSQAWIELAERLTKAADDVYKPRGRKPRLNQELATYHDLQDRVRQAADRYPAFVQLQREIQQGNANVAGLTKQVSDLRQQRDQLATVQRLWPTYEHYQELQAAAPALTAQIDDDVYNDFLAIRAEHESLKKSLEDQARQLAATDDAQSPETAFYIDHRTAFTDQAKQFDQVHDWLRERQAGRDRRTTMTTNRDELAMVHHWQPPYPTPLTSNERTALQQQLTHQNTADGSSVSSARQWWGVGAGGVLVVLGLLMSSGIKWGFILAGLALGVAGWQGWLAGVTARVMGQPVSKQQVVPPVDIQELAQKHYLTGIPVADWLSLQADSETVTTLTEQIDQLTKRDHELNDEVGQYFSRYGFADQWLPLTQLSAADALSHAEAYERRMSALVATDSARAEQRVKLIQTTEQMQARQTELTTQLGTLLAKANVANAEQLVAAYQAQQQDQQRQAQQAALGEQLTPVIQAQLAQFSDQAAVTEAVQAATTAYATAVAQREQAQRQVAQQQAQFTQQAEHDVYPQLQQELANQTTTIVDLSRQWLVNQLAAQWIDQSLTAASSDRLPLIIERAEQYFATLTLGHYPEIKLTGTDLQVVTTTGTRFTVAELSRGTAEQLYVALRLGFASVMGDRVPLPLIVDDAFVNFDEERRAAMISLLKQFAEQIQVLYFTADERLLTTVTTAQQLRLSR
ncbi:ATP-binding protein [Furfurilactobacillus entadae]|uniref:ATP-binding protein n=1 Tax=Furfurilactobacillus entadae TaxID=2922307 RepID=UPI0035EB160A